MTLRCASCGGTDVHEVAEPQETVLPSVLPGQCQVDLRAGDKVFTFEVVDVVAGALDPGMVVVDVRHRRYRRGKVIRTTVRCDEIDVEPATN